MVERSNTTDSKYVLSAITGSNPVTCIADMAEESNATGLRPVLSGIIGANPIISIKVYNQKDNK